MYLHTYALKQGCLIYCSLSSFSFTFLFEFLFFRFLFQIPVSAFAKTIPDQNSCFQHHVFSPVPVPFPMLTLFFKIYFQLLIQPLVPFRVPISLSIFLFQLAVPVPFFFQFLFFFPVSCCSFLCHFTKNNSLITQQAGSKARRIN
jgi:hypothetical protein